MNHYARTIQLVVTGLLAMVLAPPNASGGVGDYDYCTVSGPCGEGGGDCDANSECQAGLVCVQDQGAYYSAYPSPSANYDPSIVDVCEVPDPDLCADYGPCPAGNGDCDSDSECQAGLTCAADVGTRYGYPANYDVCEAPTGSSRPDPDYCVTNYCGPGDGDCDPGQCDEGVCVNDVGAQYGLPAHYDVCEAPTGSSRPDPDYCVTNYCGPGDGDCDPGQCDEGVCVNDVGAQYGLPAHYDVCEAPTGSSRPDPDYCVTNYCGPGDGDCDPGQCNEGVCVNDVGAQYGLPAHYDVCEASSGDTGSDGGGGGDWIGVCDRTPQVRGQLVAFSGQASCEDVTAEHLARITRVRLMDSNLTTLKDGDFAGLSNLHLMWLQNNPLTALPPGLFSGLSNLRQLTLNNTQLTALPPGLFSGLSNLRNLFLYNTQLTALPPGLFSGLSNLEALDLNNTQLTALPPGLFSGLSNLRALTLNNTQLTALPPGLFSGLSNLVLLTLNNTQLTALPPGLFSGLSNLRDLTLNNTQLTALPPGLFSGLSNLVLLTLNNNQLTALPPGLFADLPNDAEIRLENNPGYPFPNDGRGGGGGGGTVDCNNAWTGSEGDFQVISHCLAACAAAQAGDIQGRDANCSILRTYERHFPGTVLRYCPVCQ